MKKYSYYEIRDMFREYNDEHKQEPNPKKLFAVAVITEDTFTEKYSLEARSYRFSSDNKAFKSGMGGYSIFAGSLDGSDPCVRLERYVEDGGWKVDYCYLVE